MSVQNQNRAAMSTPNGRPRTPRGSYHAYGTIGSPNGETDVNGYEEFFGGAVSCPTCHGAGRIPREQENELVALIPMNDRRLKPRRTTLYVIIAVVACFLIGGLLLFFLFPRSVQMSNNTPNLKPDSIYINKTEGLVSMTITNAYNFTNQNFFPITVEKLDLAILFDQRVVSQTANLTVLRVPMRSTRTHYITANLTFTGDEGYIAYYCSDETRWGHTLLMPFSATGSSTWWGRSEETSLQTYEHVRCSSTDN